MKKFVTPYIKPTRYKHDSGFRTFEVGYCSVDDNHNAVDIKPLGGGVDHIFTDYRSLYDPNKRFCLNMDLTCNGFIRLWINDDKSRHLEWDTLGFVTSSMGLRAVENEEDPAL